MAGHGDGALGAVFVGDFGLAKNVATGSTYTRTGHTLGTPAYMSPEQARGELPALTPASDVWALGCILYELLSGGRKAFDGDSPAAQIGAVLTVTPPPPAGVPRAAAGVAAVCLQRRAVDRYPSAAELRNDLSRVRDGAPPVRRPPRGRRAVVVAGTVAALGLGGVAIWLGVRSPAGAGPPPAPRVAPEVARAERLAAQAWAGRLVDLDGAADRLRRALQLVPSHDAWRVQLGIIHWARHDLAAALAQWNRVAPGGAARIRAQWLAGLALYADALSLDGHGKPPDAVGRAWSEAAVGTGPAAMLARGALAMELRRYARARELAAGIGGWEAALLRGLIESSNRTGTPDTQAGIDGYTDALAEGIPMAWMYVNRGALHAARGDTAAAEADFSSAIALRPDRAVAWFNRGAQRRLRGDQAGAREDFDAAIHHDSKMVAARVARASLRRAAGDVAGALADLAVAVEEAPNDARVLAVRSAVMLTARRLDEAERDARRAVELDPANADALLTLGGVHISRRRIRAAMDCFRKVLAAPANPETRAAARRMLEACEQALAQGAPGG